MRALKTALVLILVYAGIVAAFESLIGFFQPMSGPVLVITTFDPDGTAHDRVVSRLASGGQLYVAANHWPRAWYDRTLARPDVRITVDGATRDVTAVPVTGAEHERVEADNPLPSWFRFVTGFPPRHFVRLDPR